MSHIDGLIAAHEKSMLELPDPHPQLVINLLDHILALRDEIAELKRENESFIKRDAK